MNNPKISVIMPFYNCASFLDDAISSIINQTFTDFEFIIINDASTDNSDEIVQRYLNDSRIVYIKNKENKKITHNLNKGLDLARAEIIARMDGDDVSEPERLREQYEYLMKNKDIVLVGSFATLIDRVGKKIGRKVKPLDSGSIKRDIFAYSPFIHPSVMFQKKVIINLGKYDEKYSHCQDYDLWLRLIFSGNKVANLPNALIRYRIYENSSSKRTKEIARNDLKIRRSIIKKYNLKISIKELFFMYVHFFLAVVMSGRQKQKVESLYKKMFYEE